MSVKIISSPPPLPFFPNTARLNFFVISQWGRGGDKKVEVEKANNNYEILGFCVRFKSDDVFFLPERGQNLKFKKNNLILGVLFFPPIICCCIISGLAAVWKNLFFPLPFHLLQHDNKFGYQQFIIHFNIFSSPTPSSSASTTEH